MRLWLGVSVRAVGVWTGDPVPGLLGVRIEMGCIEGVVREASVPGCVTWREALGGEGLSPRGAVRIGKVKGLAARVAERRRAARRPEQSRSGGDAGV